MSHLARPTPLLLWSACLAALGGCGDHAHDAGHDHPHEEAEDARPGLSFTVYADGLELFLETPAFVVGQPSPLVSHFTDARDPEGFAWVTAGTVTAGW